MTKQLSKQVANAQKLAKAAQFSSENRLCEFMVMMGFSNRAIRTQLKLTDYEIYKIQKGANLRKIDYRDAISPVSKAVVGKLTSAAQRKTIENIERYLLR